MEKSINGLVAVLGSQPAAQIFSQAHHVKANAVDEVFGQGVGGEQGGGVRLVEPFGEQFGAGGVEAVDGEGEGFGHVVGGRRDAPVGVGKGEPGEPGADAWLFAGAGAAAEQKVGDRGFAEGAADHVAQGTIEIGDDDGDVAGVETFIKQGAEVVGEVGYHVAAITAVYDPHNRCLGNGRWFARMQQKILHLVCQCRHLWSGNKAVCLFKGKGVARTAVKQPRPRRIRRQKPLVAATGIICQRRCFRHIHQMGDKILPGRGLLLHVVNNQVAKPFAKIFLEFRVAHKLGIKHLHHQRQIEQAVFQAGSAKTAGGFGSLGQMANVLGVACPRRLLPRNRFVQRQPIERGAVEGVEQLADDLLGAQP